MFNLKDGYLLGFSSTNDQGMTVGGMASYEPGDGALIFAGGEQL